MILSTMETTKGQVQERLSQEKRICLEGALHGILNK